MVEWNKKAAIVWQPFFGDSLGARARLCRLRSIAEQEIGRPLAYACVINMEQEPSGESPPETKKAAICGSLSLVTRSGLEPETPTLKVLCSTS